MLTGLVNILRRNGREPRSYMCLFAPNGASAVVDFYDPGDILESVTRTGTGAYTIVLRPGVAASTSWTGTSGTVRTAVCIEPTLRLSGGLTNRIIQAGTPAYDSAGRYTFTLVITDAAGTPADVGPHGGVVAQIRIEVDEGGVSG